MSILIIYNISNYYVEFRNDDDKTGNNYWCKLPIYSNVLHNIIIIFINAFFKMLKHVVLIVALLSYSPFIDIR